MKYECLEIDEHAELIDGDIAIRFSRGRGDNFILVLQKGMDEDATRFAERLVEVWNEALEKETTAESGE